MKLEHTTVIKMQTDNGKFQIVNFIDKFKSKKIKLFDKEFCLDCFEDHNQHPEKALWIDNYQFIENDLYVYINKRIKENVIYQTCDAEFNEYFASNYNGQDIEDLVLLLQEAMSVGLIKKNVLIQNICLFDEKI